MKKYFVLALFTTIIQPGLAQDHRDALKGVNQVVVSTEVSGDPAAKEVGLTEDQLKTDVELRLRRAHVKVGGSFPRDSLFSVWVNALKLKSAELWAFQVHVGLSQEVTLRNKTTALAEIWGDGTLGVVPSPVFVERVRGKVGDLVDEFINDYLAANQ